MLEESWRRELWRDDDGQIPYPASLAAEISAVGEGLLRTWAARCGWCRGRAFCAGDAYFCAGITWEWEREPFGV